MYVVDNNNKIVRTSNMIIQYLTIKKVQGRIETIQSKKALIAAVYLLIVNFRRGVA